VRLSDVDSELIAGFQTSQVELARQHLIAPLHVCRAGPIGLPPGLPIYGLVVSGFVMRLVNVGRRSSLQLLGPGDIVSFDGGADPLASVTTMFELIAVQTVELALIDDALLSVAARLPPILRRMAQRLERQSHEQAVRLALAQMPRLEIRVLGLLWLLADRWGMTSARGIVLPVPLSHSMIARMVCAQRPSVTSVMRQLADSGAIDDVRRGTMRLMGCPPELSGLPSRDTRMGMTADMPHDHELVSQL
jgi:CRP-like cAMP-binding protein